MLKNLITKKGVNPKLWQYFLVVFVLLFLWSVFELNQVSTQMSDLSTAVNNFVQSRGSTLGPPYTLIEQGNVSFVFFTARGEVAKWSVPLIDYLNIANKPKPYVFTTMSDTVVGDVTVPDYRAYLQPGTFAPFVSTLTNGRTDRQFVYEVWNMRRQLTTYGPLYGLENVTGWPLETLTSTTGTCRDFLALMASILVAGNQQTDYGMKISVMYMDSQNPQNPKLPNHVILLVRYRDGVQQCVDTVSTDTLCSYGYVKGWQLDI